MKVTEATLLRLTRLFALEDRGEAIRLLEQEFGDLLFLERAGPMQVERFYFAALKLSEGDVGRLRQSIELARQDWRALLNASGFGDSSEAHLNWHPAERTQR